MKVLSVVGARPQFIKAAVVSRVLRKEAQEILVHTGQHYDYNMSDVFFEELDIPKPDYNLGISGGSHGTMTGKMLIALEAVMKKERPDRVLVYGDTNSTLAAALAAVKLHIPVLHVEAGNRFGTLDSPEEVNRICTDHISTVLMPCTDSSMRFLELEGLGKKGHVVGDPMYDAFLFYGGKRTVHQLSDLVDFNGNQISCPEKYYYLTCHRQENTETDEKLGGLLNAMERLEFPTIYPVHPRNRDRAIRICEEREFHNIRLVQPVGYLSSVALVKGAERIVTDSGGVQREAFFAQKPCVTILDFVVWPETMICDCNQLAKPNEDILEKLSKKIVFNPDYRPFGDGHSGEKIVKLILES